MALTRSKPASIFTPEGNSLAVFIDVADGTLKLKDVFGGVELFSNFISGGGEGLKLKDNALMTTTLTQVVDKNNTASALKISTTEVTNNGGGNQPSNTAFGDNALISNTTGTSNTAFGVGALQANTIGIYNIAVGVDALLGNIDGNSNTAIGMDSLRNNTSGDENVAVGRDALYDVATGSNNTAIGFNTGRGISTGSGNTIIGANVTGLDAALTRNIIISDGVGNIRIIVNQNGIINFLGNEVTNYIPLITKGGAVNISGGNQEFYNGGVYEVTGAVTIDINDAISEGFNMSVIQADANQTTFTVSGGILILGNRQGHTKTAGQYARVELIRIGNNLILSGDTAL